MFPLYFMDCWSLYILDTKKKIMMVLDPTGKDLSDEMKRKHVSVARKFQYRFCYLFNGVFGAGLVETSGWSFVYPLVAQHDPCNRQWSLHRALLSGVHRALPTFDSEPGIDRAVVEEVCLRDCDDEGEQG